MEKRMKALGIVRKVDELGRIVLPKELRRSYMMREGDPIEIFANGEGIFLKRYEREKDAIDMIDELKLYIASNFDAGYAEKMLPKLREIETILKMLEGANNET